MKKAISLILVTVVFVVSVMAYVNPGYVSPVTEVVKSSANAVVKIDVEKTARTSIDPFMEDFFLRFFGENISPFGGQRQVSSIGSGFVIDLDGHILTNYHVVSNSSKITVTLLDGTQYTASLLGGDEDIDIAVLKLDKIKNGDLPYLEFGDSDNLQIGEWAVAIGNPLGFKNTVTLGVVSAINRKIPKPEYDGSYYNDLIQTDAAINPGNSGGPLLNIHGEVIGINTAIVDPTEGTNLGFAIPINKVVGLIDDLVKYGKVKKAYLGIKITDLDDNTRKALGITETGGSLIVEVETDSPADKAGLKPQDIIFKFDTLKVENTDHLISLVRSKKPGNAIPLQIDRNGSSLSINVILGEAQGENTSLTKEIPPIKNQEESALMGFSVSELTDITKKSYNIPEKVEGLLISSVDSSSTAYKLGLREGTVLVSINRHAVSTVNDWKEYIANLKKGDFVALYIYDTSKGNFMLSFPL